jgi:hypothetical protein
MASNICLIGFGDGDHSHSDSIWAFSSWVSQITSMNHKSEMYVLGVWQWKFRKSFEQEGSAIQKDLCNPIWGGHRLLIIIRLATKKGGWEAVADCHLARPTRGPSRSPSVWDFSYCKTGISGSKRQNPEPRCKAVVNGF